MDDQDSDFEIWITQDEFSEKVLRSCSGSEKVYKKKDPTATTEEERQVNILTLYSQPAIYIVLF